MESQGFAMMVSVEQSPGDAFRAINDVRGRRSGEIEGDTDKSGAAFTYRYGDRHRSRQTVTEAVPGKKVVWHVNDSHLSFRRQPRMDGH